MSGGKPANPWMSTITDTKFRDRRVQTAFMTLYIGAWDWLHADTPGKREHGLLEIKRACGVLESWRVPAKHEKDEEEADDKARSES